MDVTNWSAEDYRVEGKETKYEWFHMNADSQAQCHCLHTLLRELLYDKIKDESDFIEENEEIEIRNDNLLKFKRNDTKEIKF